MEPRRECEKNRLLAEPIARSSDVWRARERRQASIRPSIYLSRFYLCESTLPLVARRPVKPSSIEHLSAIGSPTTPAIKENMKRPVRVARPRTLLPRNHLGSPLPLPAFRTILLTMSLGHRMLMISLLKLILTVSILSIYFSVSIN